MDSRARDRARSFQGDRMLAVYPGSRKKLALALDVSRQAIDRHARGEARTISYEDLAALASDPTANPEAVALGALELIESVRIAEAGDPLTTAQDLDAWMTKAQQHDGNEDCKQYDVKGVISSLAFMSDNLTLTYRAQAVDILERWAACKRAEMAADMASLSYVRALVEKLRPMGGA